MKRVIDTTEVLGTVEMPEGKFEVCAAAEANFDEEGNRLVVQLSSALRSTDVRGKEKQISAAWLPVTETVTESVGAEESHDLSREIFHRWVRKVRQATPALHRNFASVLPVNLQAVLPPILFRLCANANAVH